MIKYITVVFLLLGAAFGQQIDVEVTIQYTGTAGAANFTQISPVTDLAEDYPGTRPDHGVNNNSGFESDTMGPAFKDLSGGTGPEGISAHTYGDYCIGGWCGGQGYVGQNDILMHNNGIKYLQEIMPLVLMVSGGRGELYSDRVMLEPDRIGHLWAEEGAVENSYTIRLQSPGREAVGMEIGQLDGLYAGDYAKVKWMEIKSPLRGLGLGSDAYKLWESQLPRSVKSIRLTAMDADAHAFWLKMGFNDIPGQGMRMIKNIR